MLNLGKSRPIFGLCDLAIWQMARKIGHLFYASSSLVLYFVAISELKVELQSGNAHLGRNHRHFGLCDMKIWQMTSKINRAPILCHCKSCASFRSHLWIHAGASVRDADSWDKIVLTSLTLTFCMEITFFNEDFMMIWWQEHGGIVRQADRQTDGQTDISLSLGEGNLLYGGYYYKITLRYTRVVLQQFRRNFRVFGSVPNTLVSLKSTGPSSQSYNALWEPERWLHNSASLLNR